MRINNKDVKENAGGWLGSFYTLAREVMEAWTRMLTVEMETHVDRLEVCFESKANKIF